MRYTPPVRKGRGVQQEDVFAAADALVAEGQRPTIERVRLKIGRGSPNTVSPLLDHWFAALGGRLGAAVTVPREEGASPLVRGEALPPGVQQAAQALWEAALGEAQHIQRAHLDAELQSLQNREAVLAESQAALQQREAAYDEARATLSAALASAQEARERAEQHASQAAQETVRLHKTLDGQLQQVRSQLAEVSARAERAGAEHAQIVAARDQDLRHAEQRHSAEHKRMQAEVDRARQASKALEAELTKAQQRLHKSEEAAALRLQLVREQGATEREALRGETTHLRAALSLAEQSAAKASTAAAVAQQQVASAQQRLDDEKAAHAATRELLAARLSESSPRGVVTAAPTPRARRARGG